MAAGLKCPVCGKSLTRKEFDKALGLWKEKQQHIHHLEQEQKELKVQQKRNQALLTAEKKKLKAQSLAFDRQKRELATETRKQIAAQAAKSRTALAKQAAAMQKYFDARILLKVKEGVDKGIAEQKAQLKKQQTELSKTQNKMLQLERSLQLSTSRYERASEEIKRLRTQIEKGITPQIEGLLEEATLLAKLKELFPGDRFEHPGKKGDILQYVQAQGKTAGVILYECKKVKTFSKTHVTQAKTAKVDRKADYAVLVTNAFPAKKQHYFVEKDVFVISPVSLEPIAYTLRESLLRMAVLRLTAQAKQKAVQAICDYLGGAEYRDAVAGMADQLVDLGGQLKAEMRTHKALWEKRYSAYRSMFLDVSSLDYRLTSLLQGVSPKPRRVLPAPKGKYLEIQGLKPGSHA
jgi:hypothetical protein